VTYSFAGPRRLAPTRGTARRRVCAWPNPLRPSRPAARRARVSRGSSRPAPRTLRQGPADRLGRVSSWAAYSALDPTSSPACRGGARRSCGCGTAPRRGARPCTWGREGPQRIRFFGRQGAAGAWKLLARRFRVARAPRAAARPAPLRTGSMSPGQSAGGLRGLGLAA